ncbi:MAG: 2-hydroxyacid dehydrogenase [Bacteroidia bacterium]
MSYRILFLDSNHHLLIDTLHANGFVCEEDYVSTKEEVLAKIPGYDAIVIRSRFKIDAVFIEAATNLKCIGRAGAGMENIDVAFAEARGIKCVHAPEGNRDAVGEQAIGMLLALMNNVCRADREVRSGHWIREGNRGYELQGKTVAVIGYGNMGSAFVQRLKGFDVTVLAYDRYKKNFGTADVKESTLEEIFEHADVISFHVPLTSETSYMVDDTFLSQFKKPVWLINTARGKILDTSALVHFLEHGKVRGACLDVSEYESLSFEKMDFSTLPEAFQYLIKSDKVILTPHIAGWTFESNEKIARILAEKITDAFS